MITIVDRHVWLGFTPLVDFIAWDNSDGKGPFIKTWLSASPQPTKEELDAATAPPPPPIEVSAAQAKLALDDAGLFVTVEAACEGHAVRAVRIFWRNANTWHEGHPVIQAMQAELSLTDQQVHNLFLAAQLK
jgi:hypothetical protein